LKLSKRPGKLSIGGILVVFITILIGAVLAGPFLTQVTDNLTNYTGGALAIGNQLPLFYILLLVAVIVAPVAREFSNLD
jgi:hypothetical protein